MTQLEKLKIRLENEENDQLLGQLLEDAEAQILDFTNRKEIKPSMEALQRDLAIVYYNRLGNEGVTSRSEGAVSLSYSNEIPADILARLVQHRQLKIVGVANV